MSRKRKEPHAEPAAGNGILSRRIFLERGLIAGVAGIAAGSTGALAEPLAVPRWSQEPGGDFTAYGMPSHYESKVARTWAKPNNPATPGIGSSRTPHHLLDGMITPSGLHYERSHSGVPDIDPAQHRLLIHGLVKQPLVFSLEDLSRYPRTSRISFPGMRRQQRRALERAGGAARRAGDPWPAVVLGLDRRQALDAAR